jgi:hypothetical protein
MKRVVSISLGSAKRNMRVETEFLGQKFIIERIGTDGSMKRAIELVGELDGRVDAFGMGGIDLYIAAGERRYVFRDAAKIARAAQATPIVDGSGLKNTLERKTIELLGERNIIAWPQKKVFLVSGVDRFGMAQALVEQGADVVFGDLMVGLGLPIPLTSLPKLERVAHIIAPLVCQLPFKFLYPTGKKQGKNVPRFIKQYQGADVIAGDFHFIWQNLPLSLPGKTIITNTVTAKDVEEIKRRKLSYLITTTPELNGRSFGTNVMEAVIVALLQKRPEDITPEEYGEALAAMNFEPRVIEFTENRQ